MMAARVIVFLITTTIAKHHHSSKNVLDHRENFFGNVYVAIHSIMDTLFESIGLATNFSKESSTKLLLTMHHDLSNIADKNFDAFNDVKNIIEVDVSNHTQDMIKLDAVVNEVLNENNFDVYNLLKGTQYKNKRAKNRKRDKNKNQIPEFGDSREFTEFIIKFLAKVNNLTIQDFKRSAKYGRNAVPPSKNLRVWDVPSSIELDSVNKTFTRRIFKGAKTQINKFPFVVSIHIMGEFACAGCIINRDLIITSASCLQIAYRNDFFNNNLKSIYVRLGSDHTTRAGETIPVQNLYFHPQYEPEHLLNNLALLKLEQRIRFSRQQKRIRRIMWDKTPGNLPNDTKGVLILGWGATKKNHPMRKHPKLALDMLDVFSTNDCRKIYSEDFVTKDNFCAGFRNTSGGACNGDVGGPGIVGALLVGIVSFGAPICGTVDAPTVFTKLGNYAPWIESIVNMQSKENQTSNSTQNTRRRMEDLILQVNITATDGNNNEYANLRFRGDDYPEEVKVLRDILIDLVKTDTTVVDEVIYGDLYDEFNKIFKSKEQTEEQDDEPPLNKKYSKRPPEKDYNVKSQQAETGVVTTTPTTTSDSFLNNEINSAKNKFKSYFSQSCSSSEDDMKTNNAMKNDYTDNYEKSSEERGLSIEVPRTFSIKYFADESSERTEKNQYSSKESEIQNSGSRLSEQSSENLNDNNNFFVRNRENSNKKNSDIIDSSSDEMTATTAISTHIPFSGTRLDYDSKDDTPLLFGDEAKERARKAVTKNHHVHKSISTISVHYDGKSLATRPYFIDFGKVEMTGTSKKHKRRSSTTTERAKDTVSYMKAKKKRNKNRSLRIFRPKTFVIKL